MKQAFSFGQVTFGFTFTNREEEKKRLMNNIASGIHTILISPRRWGKSSLVKQLEEENTNPAYRFCFLDLFSIKDEDDFYKQYGEAVIKATSGKWEDAISSSKKFLKNFIPSLSFGNSIDAEFDLKIGLEDARKSNEDIINLAENIARDKGITLVICLDEFQNIAEFHDGLAFQKKLRSHWQHHRHVVYCIYGSKQSMMTELFNKRKMPFYNFGDTFYLQKISKAHLVSFIIDRFSQTGKSINEAFATQIADLMECHPHYVQHLAHFVWHETTDEVCAENLENALQLLLNSYAPMFQRMYEELSRIQVNYMRAIANGHTTLLTGKDLIEEYQLGTPASVLKAIAALEKKEVIDRLYSKTEFLDPVFKIWFKKILKIN